jgi:hypothetical protein
MFFLISSGSSLNSRKILLNHVVVGECEQQVLGIDLRLAEIDGVLRGRLQAVQAALAQERLQVDGFTRTAMPARPAAGPALAFPCARARRLVRLAERLPAAAPAFERRPHIVEETLEQSTVKERFERREAGLPVRHELRVVLVAQRQQTALAVLGDRDLRGRRFSANAASGHDVFRWVGRVGHGS